MTSGSKCYCVGNSGMHNSFHMRENTPLLMTAISNLDYMVTATFVPPCYMAIHAQMMI